MYILLITARFHLPACGSLKEKRRALVGLRDKVGRTPNVAITESGYHDCHEDAEWSVVVISKDRIFVEKEGQRIENYFSTSLDAVLIDFIREWI